MKEKKRKEKKRKEKKRKEKKKKRKEQNRTEQNRTEQNKKKVVRVHDLSLDDVWELIDINHVIHVMTYGWDFYARVNANRVVKRNKVLKSRDYYFSAMIPCFMYE